MLEVTSCALTGYTQTMTPTNTKKWTIVEYERMADLGLFRPGERVELFEGDILEMSPQNVPHGHSLTHANHLLVQLFGDTHYVRVQLPLNVGERTQLEPDFALVQHRLIDEVASHPWSADLVIEVSESSLAYDRGAKLRAYAQAGIPEYWVVNLPDGLLEVYRDPDAEVGYRFRQVLKPEDVVAPQFCPGRELTVARLF